MSVCQHVQLLQRMLIQFRDPSRILFFALIISVLLHLGILGICTVQKRTLIKNPFVVMNLQMSQPRNQTYFKTVERPKPDVAPVAVQTRKKQPKKAAVTAEKKKAPVKEVPKKETKPATPPKQESPPKKQEKSAEEKKPTKVAPSPADAAQRGLPGRAVDLHGPMQAEVERLWRPPLNAPKGSLCSVRFTVSPRGVVEQAEIMTSSGILTYDMSVMRVAYQFKFDAALWGKRFTIEFRQ